MSKASQFNNIVPFHRSNVTYFDQWDIDIAVAELEDPSIHLWYLTPAFSCYVWCSRALSNIWQVLIHDCSAALNQVDKVVLEQTLTGTMHDAIRVVEVFAGIGTPSWINYDSGYGVWLYRWYDSMTGEWIELQASNTD